MNNILVITNNTAVRASVIAHRTDSEFMAGAKAIMVAELKRRMKTEVVHFLYKKHSTGEMREAWGTVMPPLVEKHTNGRGISREYYSTTAYFDVELGAFRSFRWENLITVF